MQIISTIEGVIILSALIFAVCFFGPKFLAFLHIMRMREVEYRTQKQELAKKREETNLLKWQAVRAQIDIQQASLVRVRPEESVYSLVNVNMKPLVVGQPYLKSVPQIVIPHAPTFSEMQHLITDEKNLVLGYASKEPVYGTLEDHLLSMLTTGRPKTGKSVSLLYYSAMFLKVEVLPIILDPQGSLYKLAGILPYYDSMRDIHAFIPTMYRELQEREDLWRNGNQLKPYSVVVVVDEIPMIAQWEEMNTRKGEPTILDLIGKIVLESRKMHAYVQVAGQGFPATIMKTLTRDNMSSRLVFPVSESHAKMAGLDSRYAKELLPILDVSILKEPFLIDIPFTTVNDLIPLLRDNKMYQDLTRKFSPTIVDSVVTRKGH
jgi:hypothetical protein